MKVSRYHTKYKAGELKANTDGKKRFRESTFPLVEAAFVEELDRRQNANQPTPSWEEMSLIALRIARDIDQETRFQGRGSRIYTLILLIIFVVFS